MSDDFNKGKQKEFDDFLSQFDEITEELNKNNDEKKEEAIAEFLNDTADQPRRKTRSERLQDEKQKKRENNTFAAAFSGAADKLKSITTKGTGESQGEARTSSGESAAAVTGSTNGESNFDMATKKKKKKKKYKINFKTVIRNIIIIGLVLMLIIGGWVASIIMRLPDIDPDNIYSMLTESSVLFDDAGNVISTVGGTETRSNVQYEDLPDNLVNAIIAIEDKTFETHSGFNIIRIFGAIKDAIFNGGHIGGTSTITQQLARNIYLSSDRTMSRKISEAYYTVIIEKELSKELILEAYLNTINFGFDSYGVQMAAQSYFSKDVEELTLLECAALAALPKAPSDYALIKKVDPDQIDPDSHIIIHQGDEYTYIYNGDASEARRNQVLWNMCDQGYISEEERDAALAEDLLDYINPNMRSLGAVSSYFADYAIECVINDYAAANGLDYSEAKDRIYTGGFEIHTTMDSDIQQIMDEEYSNNANFPKVASTTKDSAGNILSPTGKLLLYSYSNYFDDAGNFTLADGEYEWLDNGDLKLYGGKRLNFYNTKVQGAIDISIEFKNIYVIEDDIFYSIQGGVILIPQQFKEKDDDGNCIISADFFDSEDYKNYIQTDESGNLYVDAKHYSLKQRVVQPQSAMVITEFETGHVKGMIGGRNTVGQKLYNRAVNPRQPGSSIKPIAVYGPALQQSFEIMQGGSTPVFNLVDNSGNTVGNTYGTFWTAASVIDDSPLMFENRLWPQNWYEGYRGLYTFRESVLQSVNVNAVKVLQQVGVQYSADFVQKLGVTSLVTEGEINDMNASALALGGMTSGISPLEMTGAYSVFINEGTVVEPIVYTHVTNKNGETILEKTARTDEVMDPGVAWIMTDILRTVVTEGIGGKAAIPNQPVGGKTGTTSEVYDVWFSGFTPQYTAAVWIGNDVNLELTGTSDSAASLWSRIMARVCAGLPTGTFPSAPENVTSLEIDTKSGKVPTSLSYLDERGTIRTEYFIKGTEPTEGDDVHQVVSACSYTGYIATPMCGATYSRFGTSRPYVVDTEVADLVYELPHYYCPLHNPDPVLYPIDPNYGTGEDVNPDQGIVIDPSIITPPVDNGDISGGDIMPPIIDNGETGGDVIDSIDGGGDEPPDWL